MTDDKRTKKELLSEIGGLEKKIKMLEAMQPEYKTAEKSLRESEGKWRLLVENAPNIILIVDRNGTIEFVNHVVSGLTVEDVIGKNQYDFIEPEYREMAKEVLENVFRTGEIAAYEVPGAGPDGSEAWYETHVGPLEWKKGVKSVMLVTHDITDRKKVEDALHESEEKFKTIFDNAMDGILVVDVEAKMFLAANKIMCQMMGYTEEELKKKGIADIHRKEDLPCVQAAVQKQLSGEESMAKDIPMLRKDGSVFCADVNSVPVTLGGRTCLMGIFHDTTERARAEDVMRESEEKFRNLVERANDGICIIQDGVFRYVNDRLAAMCGLTADEMTGNAFKHYLHSSEAEKVYDRYKKRMAGEDAPAQYETKFAHRDGHEVFVDLNAGMAPYKGKPADFVIVHDITGRKKTEIEKQKQRDMMDKTNKDLRWKIEELEAALSHIKALEGLIPICVNCKKIHLEETDPKDPAAWVSLEKYISEKTDASLTHGLCPDCVKKMYDEIKREKNEG